MNLEAAAEYVTLQAASADLWSHKIVALTDAVRGLTANSLHRGAEQVRVRLWNEPEVLICDLTDDTVIDDLLIGRRATRPPGKTPSGSPTRCATSCKPGPARTEPPYGCTCGSSRRVSAVITSRARRL